MKIKFLSVLLLICLVAGSLSSCLFIDTMSDMTESEDNNRVVTGDVNVTVDEVKNHDITINSTDSGSELAAAKALMSAVTIETEVAGGSGVIFKLSEDKSVAYILTNYHVIYDSRVAGAAKSIKVYLYGMESHLYGNKTFDYSIKAQYVGGTEAYDLAVLKVEGSEILMNSNARACDFADSNAVQLLETAIAVGNARGHGISVTMGKVNVDSEDIQLIAADEKTVLSVRVMRTDAAVNKGNSGGGLFNGEGDLIGIVNARSASDEADGIGYAIPSNLARYIAENILYYCDGKTAKSAYRCLLGINVQIAELYTVYDEETGVLHRREKIRISSIASENSAAYGILKTGDIVNSITIDGVTYEVTRMFHVIDAMFNARAESNVVVNVTRGSEELNLTVPLSQNDIVNADS